MKEAAVPEHVPPHLVQDFDYWTLTQGINTSWASVRRDPPIFWTPRNGGHWMLTRHADIAFALANPADFSSRTQAVPKIETPFPLAPVEYDPPAHTEYRHLIVPYLSPKAIVALEQKARAITLSMIEGFKANGSCEFISEFALVVPIVVFMELVDLPDSDRPILLACAEDMVRGSTARKSEAFQRVFEYLAAIFAARRKEPGRDLLSALTQAKVDSGRRLLNDQELLGMGSIILGGGLDTVSSTMGFIMIHLANNEDHRSMLVNDPSLINSALDEMLRRYQIASLGREVARDITFRGVEMKKGDVVLAPTPLAGLDDEEYPNPEMVDFSRPNKRGLMFGTGPHFCAGQFLAKAELRVFLAEWLSRIPNFCIKPGTQPVIVGGPANSVQTLHLQWPVSEDQ